MVEIEGVLNGRPITYVDRELETELITPNDFLCVRYLAIPINFDGAPLSLPLTAIWKAGQEYLEQFWRLWSERYLREIRERRDSMSSVHNEEDQVPQPGELVLMIDPMLRRSSWETAVVERLIPSDDGKVRAVQIRIGENTRLVRPTCKLASLKLLMDPPEHVGELTDRNRAIVVDESGGEIEST